MTMPTETPITIDDLRRVRDDDAYRFMEIVNGVWERKHPPGSWDVTCVQYGVRVANLLRHFVDGLDRGVVDQGDMLFILDQDERGIQLMRRPDMSYIAGAQRTEHGDFTYTDAPDLAVDVISRLDKPGAVHRRLADYFASGAQQVWLIYPDVREVIQHYPNGVAHRYPMGLSVLCDDLLPGFALDVTQVFEE